MQLLLQAPACASGLLSCLLGKPSQIEPLPDQQRVLSKAVLIGGGAAAVCCFGPSQRSSNPKSSGWKVCSDRSLLLRAEGLGKSNVKVYSKVALGSRCFADGHALTPDNLDSIGVGHSLHDDLQLPAIQGWHVHGRPTKSICQGEPVCIMQVTPFPPEDRMRLFIYDDDDIRSLITCIRNAIQLAKLTHNDLCSSVHSAWLCPNHPDRSRAGYRDLQSK